MKIKPVETYINILDLLSNQELPVNGIVRELFKRTGSRNKVPLIKCLKRMSEDGLIQEKRTKIHKQKRIKYLSTVGKEVFNIMDSINEYKQNLTALSELLKELIDLYLKHGENENVIKNILRHRGWKNRQAIKYRRIIEIVANLILICWNHFLSCLRLRLMPLAYKSRYGNSLNELIGYLISDAVLFSIKLPASEFVYGSDESLVNKSDYTIESQKSQMLSEIIPMWVDLPESYFSAAKKLVAAYLQLLKISPDELNSSLEQLKALRRTGKVGDTRNKITVTVYDFDYLIAAFNECLQNST